jgi:hypothetical protein
MNPLKLAQGMTDEILNVIYKYHETMPVATVLGVLEIIKAQLLAEHMEDEDD